MVGHKQLGAEGRRTRLPHVPREDVEEVSSLIESVPWGDEILTVSAE